MENKIKWCIERHKDTNHYYDKYLPYEFHLRMVVNVANDFIHLVKNFNDGDGQSFHEGIILGAWGHDLIEDTRCSYNDVKENLGLYAANIVYAVTNEKGRNRSERANDKYYEGIRMTPGAGFVKLCDRIANVQYSKMTKSRMFEMYKKENDNFIMSLGWNDTNTHQFFPMFVYLKDLFND